MQSLIKLLFRARLISINIGSYQFNPGIVTSITTVALVYLMVTLGQWQADRAEYKDDLREKILARKDLPVISMQELPVLEDDRMFLPVRIDGQYDTEHHFLLDNKILNGRVGYDVYSPLKMSSGEAILVNRGFLPQGKTREDLPVFETPAEQLNIKGLLHKTPSKTIVLADDVNQVVSWPVVLQYIDVEEIEKILGYPVFNMVLWLDKEENHGFTRTLPALALDSAKNAGYAFQWYAMTLALLIIYIVVNTKKRDFTND
jgi:surfeit locus 1 family protein